MENSQDSKKSRRRFLADMLFVGGGLSAAALLAKSQLGGSSPTHPPDIAGAVAIPENPPMPGEPAPVKTPCEPTIEGEVEPPALDGAVVMPETVKTPPPPPQHSPAIKGKVAAPRPHPTPDSAP